jgi:hypothetical protein
MSSNIFISIPIDDLLARIGVCESEGEVACSGEIVTESSLSTEEDAYKKKSIKNYITVKKICIYSFLLYSFI